MIEEKIKFIPVPVSAAIGIGLCKALINSCNQQQPPIVQSAKNTLRCDINPANIKISVKTGLLKLTKLTESVANRSTDTGKLAQNSVLQYMAPEKVVSGKISIRGDIFSIGIVLHELLSGQRVPPAHTIQELTNRRDMHQIALFTPIAGALSFDLHKIIVKCTKTDPQERYQDIHRLMHDLEGVLCKLTLESPETVLKNYLNGGIVPTNVLHSPKKPSVVPIALASGGALVFIAAILFFLNNRQTENLFNNSKVYKPVTLDESSSKKSTIISVDNNQPAIKDSVAVSLPEVESKPAVEASANVEPPVKPKQKTKIPEKVVIKKQSLPDMRKITRSPKVSLKRSDSEILDELSNIVKSKKFTNAGIIFEKNKIDDAEYYLLYAEYFLKLGSFDRALKNIQTAMQSQSERFDSKEIGFKTFYLKAKVLSKVFNKKHDKSSGQAAMDAWYDVKFQYRSNESSPTFAEASDEIRRISSEIDSLE